MQIIEIEIEFPGGMTISDRASYQRSEGKVHISERLQRILDDFSVSEASPSISAVIDGENAQLTQSNGRWMDIAYVGQDAQGFWSNLLQPFVAPSSDQEQQLGRFCHALSVASLVGAIGFWHSVKGWTFTDVLNCSALAVAFVITFYAGLRFTKGD